MTKVYIFFQKGPTIDCEINKYTFYTRPFTEKHVLKLFETALPCLNLYIFTFMYIYQVF